MQLRSDKAFLATRTRDSSMINATTRERRLHTRFDSGYLKRVSTLRKDDKRSLCLISYTKLAEGVERGTEIETFPPFAPDEVLECIVGNVQQIDIVCALAEEICFRNLANFCD